MRAALGFLLGLLARLWIATLRVRILEDPALAVVGDERWVLAFFHGTQFALHALRRHRRRGRATAVMVSRSNDGAIQASALRLLGFSIVRGSSSRGAAGALAAMIRHVRAGSDAVFAVDGPRGPYGVAKPGAAVVAGKGGAILVPAGCASSQSWVLRRAWDRFALPRPFAKVVICLGAPVGRPEVLSESIAECNERAARELSAPAAAAALA